MRVVKERKVKNQGKHWPSQLNTVQGLYDALGNLGIESPITVQIEGENGYYQPLSIEWHDKQGDVIILRRINEKCTS